MPVVCKDFVEFTSGNAPNAVTAFQEGSATAPFRNAAAAGYGSGDLIPYAAEAGSSWEVGIGTCVAGTPNTITRTIILSSSNAGAAVDFSSGAAPKIRATLPGAYAEQLINPGCVIVRGHASNTQSFNQNAWTKLTTPLSESVDVNGWWDGVTNYRLQPNQAGIYLCTGGIQFNTLPSPAYMIAALYKNGSVYAHLARGYSNSAAGIVGCSGATLVSMNGSSDYIELWGYQSHSAAVSTFAGAERNFFTAFRVSDN